MSNKYIEEGETALYKKGENDYELCEVQKIVDLEKKVYIVLLYSNNQVVKTNKVIPLWTVDELQEFLARIFQYINKTTNKNYDIIIQTTEFLLAEKVTYNAIVVESGKPLEDQVFNSDNYETLLASIVVKIFETIFNNKEVKSAISI